MRRAFAPSLLYLALLACTPKTVSPSVAVSQGWTKEEQGLWYRGSQGSRLLPFSWLIALEEAQSEKPFLTPESVDRFGYLRPEADDRVQLPIGFAIDDGPIGRGMATDIRWAPGQGTDVKWVGMNCAACHTGQIGTGSGKPLRIDGGQTIADFQSFVSSVNAALEATAKDPAKFARFAEAVTCTTDLSRPLGTAPVRDCPVDPAVRTALKAGLDRLVERQKGIAAFNQTVSVYGHGRLDAIGHIFNKVAYLVQAPGQFASQPDAPVSYPFIWNVPQHDFVQWNGIAPNKGATLPSGERFDAGAIIRNTGEVIGVFADVDVAAKATLNGYRSSVNVRNLDAIETLLGKLQSPPWPDAVWPRSQADRELAETVGKPLFKRNCVGCHAVLGRTDTKTPIKAVMTPVWTTADKEGVGTDPWMACNAFNYEALTGRLERQKTGFLLGKERYGPRAFTRGMLVTVSVGALANPDKIKGLTETALRAAFGLPRPIQTVTVSQPSLVAQQAAKSQRLRDCRSNAGDALMAYKGRPLNGIWATAPYLHNGSVKSLTELLLPPARRATKFWVGNRVYDPVNVGYMDDRSAAGSLFRTTDDAGRAIEGNGNVGHDYGNAALTGLQRKALVEYMKSL